MKKILFLLLLAVLIYIIPALYFMDKVYFLSPIQYQNEILIRNDARGDGFFAARRGNGRRIHQGVDLLAPLGTPVLSSRSGVVLVSTLNNGMGNYIIVRHSEGITTLYGHLSRRYVKEGQLVRQGQIIGAVGKTGNANSQHILPHLHFEIRKDSVLQDPMSYLQ